MLGGVIDQLDCLETWKFLDWKTPLFISKLSFPLHNAGSTLQVIQKVGTELRNPSGPKSLSSKNGRGIEHAQRFAHQTPLVSPCDHFGHVTPPEGTAKDRAESAARPAPMNHDERAVKHKSVGGTLS